MAALGAAIPVADSMGAAIERALAEIPTDSETAKAVRYGRALRAITTPSLRCTPEYAELSPVHTLNNLALVVWALCSADGDFGAAIGNAVAAGWDTDCNARRWADSSACPACQFRSSGYAPGAAGSASTLPESANCISTTSPTGPWPWLGRLRLEHEIRGIVDAYPEKAVLLVLPASLATATVCSGGIGPLRRPHGIRSAEGSNRARHRWHRGRCSVGTAEWRSIENRWLGPEYSAEDFQGRYKVVWTEERIYLLGEFVDDVLYDAPSQPAYSILGRTIAGRSSSTKTTPVANTSSITTRLRTTYRWTTMAIDIGTDRNPARLHPITSRADGSSSQGKADLGSVHRPVRRRLCRGGDNNRPVTLAAGKVIGLMLAYNDNDGSELRENFIGSETVPSGPTDRGWIDASLFGALVLGNTE